MVMYTTTVTKIDIIYRRNILSQEKKFTIGICIINVQAQHLHRTPTISKSENSDRKTK